MNTNKPNIVYILADDMGYGDVSANNENCPFVTPNFDLMAAEGLRFTDAHSSSAVCTPSRYSILTGRYNWRSTLKSYVLGGYSQPLIKEGRETIASFLKAQGYSTNIVGKWHLGMKFKTDDSFVEQPDFDACTGVDYSAPILNSPIDYGFDYFYGISGSLDMPPYIYIENNHFTQLPDHETSSSGKAFWRKGPTAPDFVHEEVLGKLTDKVLKLIEEKKEEPFFIYFPLPAPHTPILPTKKFLNSSNTNEYGDFVLECDDCVAQVINKLKAEGLYENTIVVFTSDNGCSPSADFQELKAKGHNPSYIFRGTKADIYEGGHRIPLLITYPNLIKGGKVSSSLVCLTDFYRTVADLLGVSLPDNTAEDSVSMLPIFELSEKEQTRTELIHQSIDGSLSIREGKWKLEMCAGSGGWSYPILGKDDFSNLPKYQLYDLSNDIKESHNVIEDHPDVFKHLKALLTKQIKEGRSTKGTIQENDGVAVWETIKWII